MKVIIFGATGSLGRVVTEQALARGIRVTAFTREPARMNQAIPNLTVIKGDVQNQESVTRAIAGHETVLRTLGAGRKGRVRHLGTRNIISAMRINKVERLICQTTLGVGDSAEQLNFFWKYIMFGLFLRPAFEDHQAQEEEIFNSDLNWTIVRPAAFTDGAITGQYRHGFTGRSEKLTLKISRQDLAQFMLAQLDSDTYSKKATGISY